jgi:hypothetical protein
VFASLCIFAAVLALLGLIKQAIVAVLLCLIVDSLSLKSLLSTNVLFSQLHRGTDTTEDAESLLRASRLHAWETHLEKERRCGNLQRIPPRTHSNVYKLN